jgi:hypothetical protein
MQFFIMFIVGAVMIGAGAMLSPAWPSKQPRIGLAATFSLALIVGGTVWWSEIFGWSTLVIDYLLFALVSIVILGGTMAQAQERAEARGEELHDADMGWTGPEDLAFFALVAFLASIPLFVLNLPLGQHAAANAMLTLAAREGGTFTSLAPFYPEITGFAAPGFHALTAYLSEQLGQPIPMIHMAVGSVVAFLCVWTAYDLGSEIRDKRLGRAMALAMIGSFGIIFLLINSFYSQLMGILFALAFMTYALRYYRHHLLLDMLAAGLLLGAILYVSPMLFLVVFVAYYLCLILLHIPIRRQPSKIVAQWTILSRIGLWFGVLAVCAFGVMPWVWNNWEQLRQSQTTWQEILWNHSIYTITVTVLSGFILLWLFDHLPQFLKTLLRRIAYLQMAIIVSATFGYILIIPSLSPDIDTQNFLYTEADFAAMDWITDNVQINQRILSHPSLRWMMPITGRDGIYFENRDFFILSDNYQDELRVLQNYWKDPIADESILEKLEVDYVYLPDWVSNIEQDASRLYPYADIDSNEQVIYRAPYLELVFEQDGARVYRVIDRE